MTSRLTYTTASNSPNPVITTAAATSFPRVSSSPMYPPILDVHRSAPENNSSVQSKANGKKKTDNDNRDLNAEFLKRELATTKSRIVMLDAQIEDKDKRIAILIDNVKLLEEREHEHLFNKYFTDTNKCMGPQLSCSCMPSVNRSNHQCCRPQPVSPNTCQGTNSRTSPVEEKNLTNEDLLQSLKSDLMLILERLDKLCTTPGASSKKPQIDDPNLASHDESLNISFASVESTLDDDDEVPPNNLNF